MTLHVTATIRVGYREKLPFFEGTISDNVNVVV